MMKPSDLVLLSFAELSVGCFLLFAIALVL
jgi:hypothetical protein